MDTKEISVCPETPQELCWDRNCSNHCYYKVHTLVLKQAKPKNTSFLLSDLPYGKNKAFFNGEFENESSDLNFN